MRKNKMMRLASMLLVLTLLSTCMISGTFAKYVTTATGSDSARVAKWGIKMDGDGKALFADTYGATVKSDNGDDVVAPGTNGSYIYSVFGTPETAYEITFEGTEITKTPAGKVNDVYLGKGVYTYIDKDGKDATEYVDMDAKLENAYYKYYPVNYSVTIFANNAKTITGFESGIAKTYETLSEAMTALAAAKVEYAVGTECDLTVTIAWEWQFDKDTTPSIAVPTHSSNDVYDTILGDIADGNEDLAIAQASDYSLNLEYSFKMTATQID